MKTLDKNKWQWIFSISDSFNRIINFICVVLLTVQTIVILIMVFGRYCFSYVPNWVEQFALFCLVWFAMFSIALGVRDDSHVKVEVIDHFVSAKALIGVRTFANLCTVFFGIIMVRYGLGMTTLTWKTKLSAFKVPVGLQYFSTVAGGVFMIANAIVYTLEMLLKEKDNLRSLSEQADGDEGGM